MQTCRVDAFACSYRLFTVSLCCVWLNDRLVSDETNMLSGFPGVDEPPANLMCPVALRLLAVFRASSLMFGVPRLLLEAYFYYISICDRPVDLAWSFA